MREFNDEKMKVPFSICDVVNKMYQSCWFNDEPIRYVWNDVEIVMEKINNKK